MHPLGKKRAASLPSSAAIRSSSRCVVGSPSRSSSPTSAAAIAARIPGVGLVTVSLLRSIGMYGIWPRPHSAPRRRLSVGEDFALHLSHMPQLEHLTDLA